MLCPLSHVRKDITQAAQLNFQATEEGLCSPGENKDASDRKREVFVSAGDSVVQSAESDEDTLISILEARIGEDNSLNPVMGRTDVELSFEARNEELEDEVL
jgi:hypothetical protein